MATAARKKDDVCRAAVERLAPKDACRAPFVRHSLKTDDLAKARSRRDILEKADNELWAAMLLKGCPVNLLDRTELFRIARLKVTVLATGPSAVRQ